MHQTALPSSAPFWEADEHFKILAHPSQILLWSCDAKGYFDFFSPSWLAFTGRHSADELGQGWLDRVHPEDRPGLQEGIHQSLQEESGFRYKFRARRRDGIYCWLAMEGMPRQGPDARFSGFSGFCLDITPYEEGEAAMRLSTRQISDLLRQTHLLALALDSRGSVQFANGRSCELLGGEEEEICDRSFFDHFGSSAPDTNPSLLFPDGCQTPDFPDTFETSTLGITPPRLILWHSLVLREYAGDPSGVVLIGEDITERRQAEEKLLLTSKVFETTDHAMVITDNQCRILSVNGAFTRLTGYPKEEVIGQNPRILQSGRHGPEFYREMWDTLFKSGHWHGDIWDRRKDGSVYPKFLSISLLREDDGKISHFCGIFYDITERKAVEETLDRLAHYDALTGLPNRSLLRENLDRAISQATRSGTRVALLYIDLDHFKEVNDTLGHGAGDQLLQEMARRMKTCVRGYDTVARIGGDEFVVLLPDVLRIPDIAGVAEKLVAVLETPVRLNGHSVVCTPSIGISIYPDDHDGQESLLANADQAMYQVKAAGRRGFRFYGDGSDKT